MIEFNVAEALDKLDMMSEDEAREWIAELDKEEITRMVEYVLEGIRERRYKQACDLVLIQRAGNSKAVVPEFKDGSCKEWLEQQSKK